MVLVGFVKDIGMLVKAILIQAFFQIMLFSLVLALIAFVGLLID